MQNNSDARTNGRASPAPQDSSQVRRPDGTFQKGHSGNPGGNAPGTRRRVHALAERLLEDEAENLIITAIKLAYTGDSALLRLLVDRLLPRWPTATRFTLPKITNAATAAIALEAVSAGLANADLSADEAAALARTIESITAAVRAAEAERLAEEEAHS